MMPTVELPLKKRIHELERGLDQAKAELEDVLITMNHARVFITSRQKMHSTGVGLWDEQVERIKRLKGDNNV